MSLKRAEQVLRIESEAIIRLIPRLGNNFKKALDLLYRCKGRVVVTGMGKAGVSLCRVVWWERQDGKPTRFACRVPMKLFKEE